MSEVLVRCESVSKKFCRDLKKSLWYGVKDSFTDLFSAAASDIQGTNPLREGEFWANRDISFELKRGECLGLIGRNGAGKTTLLKMLNGLIKPDHGRVEMTGRVGAMIALGAGFDPVLTGRENVLVNGSILGLTSRVVKSKLDEIVAFAELDEFIDTPVRNYSSGMTVRLGFAVASILQEPDVLILDEVLAVGDANFRFKCSNRIAAIQKQAAVILVSHQMTHIAEITNTCLLLEKGEAVAADQEAIDRYIQPTTADRKSGKEKIALAMTRHPIESVTTEHASEISYGHPLTVDLEIESSDEVKGLRIRLVVTASGGSRLAEGDTSNTDQEILLPKGSSKLQLQTGPVRLAGGTYYLSIVGHNKSNRAEQFFWSEREISFHVTDSCSTGQHTILDLNCSLTRLGSKASET